MSKVRAHIDETEQAIVLPLHGTSTVAQMVSRKLASASPQEQGTSAPEYMGADDDKNSCSCPITLAKC